LKIHNLGIFSNLIKIKLKPKKNIIKRTNMEEKQIVYTLEGTGTRETNLKNEATNLMTKLKNQFGSTHSVTADAFGELGKDWSHEIKIRKGDKVGAAVTIKWVKTNPEVLTLSVDESSKMGSRILYGGLFSFMAIGAYLGYNHIGPFAALPGQKIATALSALIMAIPGIIVVYILKSMLLKNEKEENKQLVASVINVCKK